MPKKRKRAKSFADLTWDDLDRWVEDRIVARGRKYQQQGRVSELAVTTDGSLLAWVSGTRPYATKVDRDEDGLPTSVCSCPYQVDCKHGVAVVLEYLERIKKDRTIPQASENDDRLVLLEGVDDEDLSEEGQAGLPGPVRVEIEPFLQDKSKAELLELLLDFAQQHPDIAQDLRDRRQITSGRTKTLVARLRREIREIGDQPDWDDYDLSSAFEEYLDRRHPKEAWGTLADQLLAQFRSFDDSAYTEEFSRNYARSRLSDWAISALERAGRSEEIIPLCETEARKTKSYDRLVEWLIHKHRYEEAERWIRAAGKNRFGINTSLREHFKTILTRRRNLPALAAMAVDEFVSAPSVQAFADGEKTSGKIGVWPQVREHLLTYLEKGVLPWKQKGWPLPPAGLEAPQPSARRSFPMTEVLIDLALEEKDPERVLYWYDRRPKKRSAWLWGADDRIATALQEYAPDRAIAIWKEQAERLIAETKPRAYEEAARHLRKAGAVMAREGREEEWKQYLQDLRIRHARKSRLMEVLDRLSRKRIAAQK